jgi:hypothetical protein
MRKFTSYIILLFLAFQIQIFSQTPEENENKNLVLIVKNDGGEFIGEIISDDGREILVVTKAIGKIFINKSDISSITKVDEGLKNKENKEFRASGPFTTRYYFTTNALPIKKNDNYGLIHLYGPEIHLSVGNKTSIGLMATWIASPIALVLKQQIYSNNNFHVSIGSIIGSSGYINQGQTYGGLHWGTMTFGNRLSNVSFSAGLAHINWTENTNSNDYTYNSVFMTSARDIGDKNSYSFVNGNHPYYIPPIVQGNSSINSSINSSFYSAFNNTVNEDEYQYNSLKYYKSKQLASVIGFSGIVPFGKKASFIFDSMLFIANKSKVSYTDKEIDVTYTYDTNNPATGTPTPQTETQTVIYGEGSIGSETSRSTTFIFMPAMRFNQSYTSSFQVALAGFINKNENGSTSAPIPMISWLTKF